jgi:hypothetical protein
MSLRCTVGGARGTSEAKFADAVAGVLDNAFGGEGEWEGTIPRQFGEVAGTSSSEFQEKAVAVLGANALPNLLALGEDGRGVYLTSARANDRLASVRGFSSALCKPSGTPPQVGSPRREVGIAPG